MEAIDVGQGDSLLLITPDGKDAAGRRRRLWRRPAPGTAGFRHRRRGGLAGSVGARHPASGRGGAEPRALRPHGRLARGAAQLPSRRTMGGQQSARRRLQRAAGRGRRAACARAQLSRRRRFHLRQHAGQCSGAVSRLSAGRGAHQQRFAGAACGLRRNFRHAGGRCGSAHRTSDACRAGTCEHAAQSGPSRQHYLHAAGVSGARSAAVGGDLVRTAQPLRPSARGGA